MVELELEKTKKALTDLAVCLGRKGWNLISETYSMYDGLKYQDWKMLVKPYQDHQEWQKANQISKKKKKKSSGRRQAFTVWTTCSQWRKMIYRLARQRIRRIVLWLKSKAETILGKKDVRGFNITLSLCKTRTLSWRIRPSIQTTTLMAIRKTTLWVRVEWGVSIMSSKSNLRIAERNRFSSNGVRETNRVVRCQRYVLPSSRLMQGP